ncbi:hypothetical protein MUP77_22255 [Candidatus Bathyarchaeota archaeon]|nr:hypothetical protein [Candidatus Bathyarchaeota archaeon]
MSLQVGLYDSGHRPRLEYAKSYFLGYTDRDPDLEGLKDFYCDWRDYSEYMLIQKQTESLRIEGEIERETFECSKRGNDVYWRRIDRRLGSLHKLEDRAFFDPHSNVKTSKVLFATLTYDTSRCSMKEAWENIGEEFNNWIRNLRKKFGRISYLRGWESSKKGYPHIHVLMVFHDYDFKINFSQLKGHRQVYRIEEKEEFEKSWHSFVDVQAIRKMREGIGYVTKYMTKTRYESEKQILTLALCWIFEKRSFAVSGDLYEVIYTLIKIRKMVQTDLFSNPIALDCKWILIGIYSAELLDINPSTWSCHIDLNDFIVEWNNNDKFATLIRKESNVPNKNRVILDEILT